VISRVVAKLIARRLRDWAETHKLLIGEQWGFRPGRSTRHAVLVFRMLTQVFAQHFPDISQDSLVWVLVDIKKAYPNVPREFCWGCLAKLGVPSKMVQILDILHSSTQYTVRTKGGDSRC
jgi:hypothetical protein